jgi:flagellar L-ring protein precursor FlgH
MKKVIIVLSLTFIVSITLADSVWSSQSYNIYTNKHIFKVGDIVMVNVYESSVTQNQVNESKQKNISWATTIGSASKLFGLNLNSFLPISHKTSYSDKTNGSNNSKVLLEITAKVTDILANGNLYIEGEKIINIDSRGEKMIVKGIVRPQDIDSNNAVDSNKISDAIISYKGGTMFVSNQDNEGVLSWIFARLTDFIF